jgi:hypothetical protein
MGWRWGAEATTDDSEWALVAGDVHGEILQYKADKGEVRGNTIRPKCAWRWSSPKEVATVVLLCDSGEGTAKDAWDVIATMRVGHDRVKKATTYQLCQNSNLATFDDDETVEDYALRLSGMAAHLATLGEEVKDGEIVVKVLWSLQPRFKQITIVIKAILDVSTLLRWRLSSRRGRCTPTMTKRRTVMPRHRS